MKIPMEVLARFGLDRFGVEVVTEKTEGGIIAYNVNTFPVMDHVTADDIQARLNDLIEPGMTSASAFMTSDGGFAMQGFKPGARGTICSIVADGRKGYLGKLDWMEDETNLKTVAIRTIDAMVYDGVDLSKAVYEYGCAPHFAVSCSLVRGTNYFAEDKTYHIVLPGTDCSVNNGDFKAWFNAEVKTRFLALVEANVETRMDQIKETARKALGNIERLERSRPRKHNA